MSFASLYSHGFVRVAAAVPRMRIGEPEFNAERTLELAARASREHASVVIFPELGISGYSIDDLLHQTALLDAVVGALEHVVSESASLSPVIVVGAPLRFEHGVFNTAVVIHRDRVLGRRCPRATCPNTASSTRSANSGRRATPFGDVVRLFASSEEVPFGADLLFTARDLPEFILNVEICEDLWVPIPPSTYGALAGATVLANLSASNITIGKADYRRELCASQSARTIAGYLYTAAGHGRVDDRPRVGRSSADLRERRHARRVRTVRDRRAADPRRPRSRPDRRRPCRTSSYGDSIGDHRRRLSRLRRITFDLGVEGLVGRGRAASPAGRAVPVRAVRSVPAATLAATRSTASRCAASRPACRRPASTRS